MKGLGRVVGADRLLCSRYHLGTLPCYFAYTQGVVQDDGLKLIQNILNRPRKPPRDRTLSHGRLMRGGIGRIDRHFVV